MRRHTKGKRTQQGKHEHDGKQTHGRCRKMQGGADTKKGPAQGERKCLPTKTPIYRIKTKSRYTRRYANTPSDTDAEDSTKTCTQAPTVKNRPRRRHIRTDPRHGGADDKTDAHKEKKRGHRKRQGCTIPTKEMGVHQGNRRC